MRAAIIVAALLLAACAAGDAYYDCGGERISLSLAKDGSVKFEGEKIDVRGRISVRADRKAGNFEGEGHIEGEWWKRRGDSPAEVMWGFCDLYHKATTPFPDEDDLLEELKKFVESSREE